MRRISLRFTSAVDAIYTLPKHGRLTVTLNDSYTCKHFHFKIITVIITITTITTTVGLVLLYVHRGELAY